MMEHQQSEEKNVAPGREINWAEGLIAEFDHIFPDFISAIKGYLIVDDWP